MKINNINITEEAPASYTSVASIGKIYYQSFPNKVSIYRRDNTCTDKDNYVCIANIKRKTGQGWRFVPTKSWKESKLEHFGNAFENKTIYSGSKTISKMLSEIFKKFGITNDGVEQLQITESVVITEETVGKNFAGMSAKEIMESLGVNTLVGADLKYADLTGADLQGTNLTDADLYMAKMDRANISNAYLKNTNLFYAKLNNTIATNVDFISVKFNNVVASNINLKNSRFIKASISGASLTSANLVSVLFKGSTIIDSNMADSRLENSIFADTRVIKTHFAKADFRNTTWHRSIFQQSYFENANLAMAKIDWCDVLRCVLDNVNFQYATVEKSDFTDSSLENIDFNSFTKFKSVVLDKKYSEKFNFLSESTQLLEYQNEFNFYLRTLSSGSVVGRKAKSIIETREKQYFDLYKMIQKDVLSFLEELEKHPEEAKGMFLDDIRQNKDQVARHILQQFFDDLK